jgi:hypothetical protein
MNANSTAFPIPGVKLTQFQARVWEWLRRKAHLPQGICHAARTMAAHFDCSKRYVERTLKFFRDLGVLERVSDYSLRTRRRLRLKAPTTTNSFVAPQCAHETPSSAPTDGPPLDPPMCVSGEREEEGIGGGGEPDTPCDPEPAAIPSPPPPLDSISPSREPETASEPARAEGKATPEQVEALVATAKEVFPEQPRQWVTGLARRWSLRWVRAALARAKAKGQVRTGYVIRTLEGFAAEGGPPVEIADPEKAERDRLARREELIRQCEEELARTPPLDPDKFVPKYKSTGWNR